MQILNFSIRDLKLIKSFAGIAIRDKYLGSFFGSMWAILQPLMLLSLYTFVFAFVFKARVPGVESTLAYTIWLISGFGPWLAFNESIITATTSITANANLVKNMILKTELLPISSALVGIVPITVCFIFLLPLIIYDGGQITWHIIFLIPITLILFLLVIGLGLFFSAINVFFRDFGIALPNLLMMFLFATPIFYPKSATPLILQKISAYNPFYIIASAVRQSLLEAQAPPLIPLLYVFGCALFLILVGLYFFRRLKGHFEGML